MKHTLQGMDRRGKLLAGFAVFLIFMWVCTIISKSIYVSGIPVVRTVAPQEKYIEHTIEADGVVTGGGEQAVCTLAGIRVKQICVKEGDKVQQGDTLLMLDKEDLQQQIRKQELEIARLNAEVDELMASQTRSQQTREVGILREQEDYALLDTETQRQVERAKRERDEAITALAQHMKTQTSVTSQVERQNAQNAYQSWQQEIAGVNVEITGQELKLEEAERELEKLQADIAAGSVVGEDVLIDAQARVTESRQTLADLKLKLSEQENKQMTPPDYSQQDSEYENWLAAKKALEDEVQAAEDALQDAELARQNALREQSREVADAQISDISTSQLEQSRIALQLMQEEAEGYQNLLKLGGMVTAPSDGVVIRVAAATGERTTDTAAVLMTQEGVACQFCLTVSPQQKDYVKVGDSMKVKFTRDGTEQEARVVLLTQSEAGTGYLDAYLDLPPGVGQPQELGSVKKSVQGELKSDCIPIEALHKKDDRYVVYLLQEREGILGKEQYVEELTVRIADQNDKFAAIEEGMLPPQATIIVHASREISTGDVVRVQSN